MKALIKSMIVVIFVAILAIPSTAQNMADIKMKIAEIQAELANNLIAGDFDSGLKYYADDIISLPNWSPMIKGKEAIIEANKINKQQGFKFKSFNANPIEIMGNDNLIYEIGTYSLTMTMPDFPQEITDYGKYVNIWEIQKDGSLLIKVEIWNTSKNPMEMMGGKMPEKEPAKDIKGAIDVENKPVKKR